MNDYIFNSYFKYMTIPYKSRGADFEGCDCWGLIRLYYKEELEISLPDFTSFACAETELFETVQTPKEHDVVLIAHKNVINHCGIVLSGGDFIHSLEYSGVQISKLARWSSKVRSYHRHITGI